LFPSGLRTRTPPTRFFRGNRFSQSASDAAASALFRMQRCYCQVERLQSRPLSSLDEYFFNGGVGNDRVKRVGFFLVGRTKREDLSPSKRFSRVFPAFMFLDGFNGLS
jgi:hypothetical protein